METWLYFLTGIFIGGAITFLLSRLQAIRKGKDLAVLESKNAMLKEQLEAFQNQNQHLTQTTKTLFEQTAARLMEKNLQKIHTANNEELQKALFPFKERLTLFEKTFREENMDNAKERTRLMEQVSQLARLNVELSQEAKNLTTALKGDTKTQGNWGEVILERILENSGLTKGKEYFAQYHGENQEGKKIQPDILVLLPENKGLIIDAKVSLTAFEQISSAENQDAREVLIKKHIASVKNHIKGLAQKKYHTLDNISSPEFVLLFMPVEPAFAMAMQYAPDLYQYAWDRKIVMVSPTTLLATLRTISSIWKHERQTQNALLIAEEAGKMHDKFVGFVQDLDAIQKNLNQTQEAFDKAKNKLSTGRGNLVRKAEKLKEMGAKASKTIPGNFMQDE